MNQENKKKGFVPLYHSILDNPLIMKDADHLALWCLLLLLARHEQRQELLGGHQITVKSGQFTTGRKQLAQRVNNGFSESKVERMLNAFESAQQIEQHKTTTNRLITILNWQNYKLGEQHFEQQVNNDRTTSEQRVNTHKESKERKKEKNTIYTEPFLAFFNAYPKRVGKKQAFTIWQRKGLDSKVEDISAFIQKAKTTRQWLEGYVPNPTTFLNGDRWEDDVGAYNRVSNLNINLDNL